MSRAPIHVLIQLVDSRHLLNKHGLTVLICHDGSLACTDKGRIIPKYLVFGGYVQHLFPRTL